MPQNIEKKNWGNYYNVHDKQKEFLQIKMQKTVSQASLVAQWLRICLPMQGTQVQSLVREDSHMPWSN